MNPIFEMALKAFSNMQYCAMCGDFVVGMKAIDAHTNNCRGHKSDPIMDKLNEISDRLAKVENGRTNT